MSGCFPLFPLLIKGMLKGIYMFTLAHLSVNAPL